MRDVLAVCLQFITITRDCSRHRCHSYMHLGTMDPLPPIPPLAFGSSIDESKTADGWSLDRCGDGCRKSADFLRHVFTAAFDTTPHTTAAAVGADAVTTAAVAAPSSDTTSVLEAQHDGPRSPGASAVVRPNPRTLVLPFSRPRKPLVALGRPTSQLTWLPLATFTELGVSFHGSHLPGEHTVSHFVVLGKDEENGTKSADTGATAVYRVAAVVPAGLCDALLEAGQAAHPRAKVRFVALRSCLATSLGQAGTASATLAYVRAGAWWCKCKYSGWNACFCFTAVHSVLLSLSHATPDVVLSLSVRVVQASCLLTWQGATRFCGSCGAATVATDGGVNMQCSGPSCSKRLYPRTNPVVIVLVVHPDGERVLLQRAASFPPGVYTCISGFVDPGETAAGAVRREVAEETAIKVHNPRWVGGGGRTRSVVCGTARLALFLRQHRCVSPQSVRFLCRAVRCHSTDPKAPRPGQRHAGRTVS